MGLDLQENMAGRVPMIQREWIYRKAWQGHDPMIQREWCHSAPSPALLSLLQWQPPVPPIAAGSCWHSSCLVKVTMNSWTDNLKNPHFKNFFLKLFCVLTLCFKLSNANPHALARVWKFYLIANITNGIKTSSKFQGEKKSLISSYQWTQRSTVPSVSQRFFPHEFSHLR